MKRNKQTAESDSRARAKVISSESFRDYWRAHNEQFSVVDLDEDPDGLGIVCHAGAADYVNRYAAVCQERVFRDLLRLIPPQSPKPRALDVGCGAGRWSQRLSARGYEVTGIDLQPELLAQNRRRFPNIEFLYVAVQDFKGRDIDLVVSVTVIQHNPHSEQEKIVGRLREILRTGGYVLAMENMVDHLSHVFARDRDEWQRLFLRHSFELVAYRPYDFRLMQRIGRLMRRTKRESMAECPPAAVPDGPAPVTPRDLVKRAIVRVDRMAEPLLYGFHAPLATHGAFLFRAV